MNDVLESLLVLLQGIDPPYWVIAIIVVLVFTSVWSGWRYGPEWIGAQGEKLVAKRLREGLPEEYLIFNNVFLPLWDGSTTQIDHVVISRFGIFAVETKTYSGWIFANERSAKWMQIIYKDRNQFQNPIRQNYLHRCVLAAALGEPKGQVVGVVAFTGDCEFKTEMPSGVVYSRDLANYILGYTMKVYSTEDVARMAKRLQEVEAGVSQERRDNHVANLHRRHCRMNS